MDKGLVTFYAIVTNIQYFVNAQRNYQESEESYSPYSLPWDQYDHSRLDADDYWRDYEYYSRASEKDLMRYLQVDDIDSGKYDDPKKRPANCCARPCRKNDRRICYYQFKIEAYTSLNWACGNCPSNYSDCFNKGCVPTLGYEKAIYVINRRMPAPSIHVCHGDILVIDVHNLMPGRSTTIHWHGIKQKNHKFMDGVPMVTQCPITEMTTFRYAYRAEYGIHFYHSHDAFQKLDGVDGSLIVRKPEDPNRKFYDHDLLSHKCTIQDWHPMTGDALWPGTRFQPDNDHIPRSYLINGRGQYVINGTRTTTPMSEFTVKKGYRYLFHIIAGTCFACQLIFTVEKHDLLIVALDACDIEPYRVNSLTMSPGERYSVVVDAKKQVSAYWISVRATGFCASGKAHQEAILRYEGGPKTPPSPRPDHLQSDVNPVGLTISPLNSVCTPETKKKDGYCIQDLRSVNDAPKDLTTRRPEVWLLWVWGSHRFTFDEFFGGSKSYVYQWIPGFGALANTANGCANVPSSSPLLSQLGDVKDQICPTTGNLSTWNSKPCQCTHVIKVPADKVVEIVSINDAPYNKNGISHAIHLHGHDMSMIEQGEMPPGSNLNEKVKKLLKYLNSDKRKEIPRNPVMKDTYALTAGGYAVKRIRTNNPGFWFVHCHFLPHAESGMSFTLQVGDPKTFPKRPKDFPTCGDYPRKHRHY